MGTFWRIVRRVLLVLGITGLVIGLVVFGAAQVVWMRQSNRLKQAMIEANRFDLGWTYPDLLASRAEERPPDDRNGALQAQRAFDALEGPWRPNPPTATGESQPGSVSAPDEMVAPAYRELLDRLAETPPNGQLSPDLAQRIEADLDTQRAAVAESRRLIEYERGQTTFKPTFNPIETPLKLTQDIRQPARLLSLDSALRAQHGDLEGAVESARAILQLAAVLDDEPTLISQLVRMAVEGVAIETYQRALGQGEPPSQALDAMRKSLMRSVASNRLLVGLRGERAMYFDALNKLTAGSMQASELAGTGQPGDVVRVVRRPNLFGQIFYRSNQASGLKMLTEAVEIARKPVEQQAPYWEQWDRYVRGTQLGWRQFDRLLTSLLMPAMGATARADRRTVAALRCAVAATACERFRQAQGHWPLSLEELVPVYLEAVPLDPADGAPLRLKRSSEGLVIYSLGSDGVDNDGVAPPLGKPRDEAGFDLTFTLFDPDQRGIEPTPAAQPAAEIPENVFAH